MDLRTTTRFRRERAAGPAARAFVRYALRSVGAPTATVDALVLAVAEACNNAILHASGDAFSVTVDVDSDRCLVAVSDSGAGFLPPDHARMPAPEATGHRGLALMEALVDRVDVASNGGGTTVRLVQSLASGGRAHRLADR